MKKCVCTMMICLLCVLFFCPMVPAEEKKITDTFPFFPSLLNTVDGKPVKPDAFESSEICMGCHPDIYKQWKGSMHSSSFIDPVFQALWKLGEQETKGFTRQLCGGCHSVAGVVSNDIVFKDGEFHASDIVKEGVQCDVCHTVKESSFLETPTYEPQNASLIVDPGDVKRGPYKDSESQYHDTAYSELHTKSEFCANCHQVFHPVTNFHIERTYDEWKYSIYAQNDIQCQDCHMMPIEKAVETAKTLKRPVNPGQPCITGPQRENMFTHEFVGGNFTVPALLGYKKHAAIAEQRLKSAAELNLQAPAAGTPGDMVTVAVKVTNVAAGHNLPTSLTEVRQMWLDVRVTDASGKELLRSGNLDKAHNIINDARIFNAYALDKDGQHTMKPWEIARFEYNKTIPPKGSATEKFSFVIPKKTVGPITVQTTLRYRSYPQSLANLLLGEGAPVLPIVDMAAKTTTIKVN